MIVRISSKKDVMVEYNKIKNVKLMNDNYTSAIKFMNPRGSNYDADMMTNAPGEVVDFDGVKIIRYVRR